MQEDIEIRKLTHLDWNKVLSIYDEAIHLGDFIFETKVPSWYQWNQKHHEDCRFVALVNNQIVAFSSISKYSNNPMFKGVASLTIYISRAFYGYGITDKLLNKTIRASETFGFRSLQYKLYSNEKDAIQFFQKFGFEIIGVQKKIVKQGGKWRDIALMERRSRIIDN